MRVRMALGFCLAAVLWGLPAPGAESAPTDLSWMAGTWEGEMWGGHNVESWAAAADGSLLGSYRFSKDGKPVFYELMAIEAVNGERILTMRHFGPGLSAREEKDAALRFSVELTGAAEAAFRQVFPEGKDTTLRYRRVSAGQLQVELIKGKDGKQSVDRFVFRRAATP